MHRPQKINEKNLKVLCWKRGCSVLELARIIGKHPTTVYRAVKRPHQYQPTYRQIVEALTINAD
jgi:IS30 family transposase